MIRVDPTADVSPAAKIGDGTVIWHYSQIREDASLGKECVVGRGAYIGTGVSIGNRCKVQNYALLYEPAELGPGVFIGPAVVLTNDTHPRAVTPDGHLKGASDWHAVGVRIGEGASIGARSVCVAPVQVGAWAMIGAGAVVVQDVPDYALVVGVPARQLGWVGRSGQALVPDGTDRWRCPATGDLYQESGGVLAPAD